MSSIVNKTKLRVRKKTIITNNNNTQTASSTSTNNSFIPVTIPGKELLLTKKERYCQEYLVDLNIIQAGKRAGYKAEQYIYNLMNEKAVQDRITYLMWLRQKRLEITQDRVLQELSCIAFFNIKDIYNDDGTLKEINSMPRETTSAIQSLESLIQRNRQGNEIGIVKKVKAEGKLVALEKLAKHLGMFQEGGITDPALLQMRERKTELQNLTEQELLQLSKLMQKATVTTEGSTVH